MPTKFENQYRNFHEFHYAEQYLTSSQTDGIILSKFDGEFYAWCETYSSDVNWQQRVPARVDRIDGRFVKTAEVDRTNVAEADFDEVTEIVLAVDTGDVYDLTIDEAIGETEALPNDFLSNLKAGTTIRLEQSSTNWKGTVQSVEHQDGNEYVVKVEFPSGDRTGTVSTGSSVTIKIGTSTDATTWKNVAYEGEDVVFDAEGESKVLNVSAQVEYRFNTSSAGSIIYVSPIWINASSE